MKEKIIGLLGSLLIGLSFFESISLPTFVTGSLFLTIAIHSLCISPRVYNNFLIALIFLSLGILGMYFYTDPYLSQLIFSLIGRYENLILITYYLSLLISAYFLKRGFLLIGETYDTYLLNIGTTIVLLASAASIFYFSSYLWLIGWMIIGYGIMDMEREIKLSPRLSQMEYLES